MRFIFLWFFDGEVFLADKTVFFCLVSNVVMILEQLRRTLNAALNWKPGTT